MAIQIIGNVGNQGYALPMVSAYPVDVNSQYLLAWNPTQQALDYVPYVGNALGDFTVTRDLAVTRNAAITGTLAVTGTTTLTGAATVTGALIPNGGIAPTDGGLEITGTVAVSGALTTTQLNAVVGGNNASVQSNGLFVQGTKSVGLRQFGWAAATGTATRTTFDTATVTLPQLAERVKALLDDLTTHGLIGP